MSCCFLECSLVFPTPNDKGEKDVLAEEPLLDYENDVDYRKLKCTLSVARLLASLRRLRRWIYNTLTSKGCRKCWCRTLLVILILLFGTFMILFVIIPLIFRNSAELQKKLIFHPVNQPHSNYEKKHFNCWQVPTLKNDYFIMNDLKIGFWNLSAPSDNRYNRGRGSYVNSAIYFRPKPTLIYFHMENGDRHKFSEICCGLSDYFNVLIFDYRSYGDSSELNLIEGGLVDDSEHLYKWVLNQTKGDIYVWGDKLGAAIATHTISRLHSESIVPTGLILENPFTSLSDIITTWYWPLGKIFSWMPWYNGFITKPLMENDLSFNTKEYILNVDCPIMILKTYYTSGSQFTEKLAVAAAERDFSSQGSVILNSMWWSSSSFYSNSFEDIINNFMKECNSFKSNKTSG